MILKEEGGKLCCGFTELRKMKCAASVVAVVTELGLYNRDRDFCL